MSRYVKVGDHWLGLPPLETTPGTYVAAANPIPWEDEMSEPGETLSVQEAPTLKNFHVTINGTHDFEMKAEHAADVLHQLQQSASAGTRVPNSGPPTWIVNYSAICTIQIEAL